LSLCGQPGARVTVANGDSELLRGRARELAREVRWVHADDEAAADWTDALGLRGAHNRRNALIAHGCLDVLGVIAAHDGARLRAPAEGFTVLPYRLEPVVTVGGVEFVDDSLSTNVLSALAGVDAFAGRRIALIVGGADRGIDYAAL